MRPISKQREDSQGRRGAPQQSQPVTLSNLLAPRQPSRQSLSRTRAQQPACPDDDDDMDLGTGGLDPTTNIRADNATNANEQRRTKLVVPSKLIKAANHQNKALPLVKQVVADKAGTPKPALPLRIKNTYKGAGGAAASIASSFQSITTLQQKAPTPVKLQKLNEEDFRRTFYGFTWEFATDVDLYFKNYNRFIKESKNKIDVQVKANKREKQQHTQFLNREEIDFWKEFPRNLNFYHASLFKIKQALETVVGGAKASLRGISGGAQSTIEVRGVDLAVLTALDFLPFSSRKFCQMFNVEQCGYLMDDAWRNRSVANDHQDGNMNRQDEESFASMATAATNISTFDTLTQALKMFDSEDAQNWRILGLTSMLLVADTIALILEQPSKIQQDLDKKNQVDPLPKIDLSPEVAQKLVDYCRIFATFKFPTDAAASDELEELSIADILFDKAQFTWANKIYPSLSTLSGTYFDSCLKLLQRALQNDHRVVSQEEKEFFIQEIYFCRYLVITPESVNMADKVLGLLEKFLQLLNSEHCNDDFKLGLLATLKYLVENLCFYQSEVCGRQNVLPLRGCSFDPNAMQIQAASVARIYSAAETMASRSNYKEHAVLLMATILKISHKDFVEHKLPSFLTLIKFKDFFKSKKTYAFELKLTNQLYITGPIHLQKYKAWQPKVHTKKSLMIENRAFRLLTPVVDMVGSMDHICLGRKLPLRPLPANLLPQALTQPKKVSRYLIHSLPDYFQMMFNPQLVGLKTCPVDYTHWQFLEQAAYDDFEFIGEQGIPYLLNQRWIELGIPLVNLGLKLADYVLDPSKDFRGKYYQLHGGIMSQKGMMLGAQLKVLRMTVCDTLKDILRSEQHINSTFMTKCMTFFRDTETKNLCNDHISAVWSKPDLENLLQRPAQISKDLKSQDLARFHLQERHRLITFEDLNELNSTDFTYENEYLNKLSRDIDSQLGKAVWDKKKEKFIRQRLECFVAQQATQGSQSSPISKLPGANTRRQNTSLYSAIPDCEKEQLKLLRSIVKMLHYLPEMHDFFKFNPTKHIIREQNALLTNRVKPISYTSDEQLFEEQKAPTEQVVENAVPEGVLTGEEAKQTVNIDGKLAEVQKLLPHLLLNLDFSVVSKTMSCFEKMMIYGDLALRISLVDQMIYFIKELMLESPEEYLVVQCLQTLLNMIKIWHQSEKIKFQATTDQEIRPGFKLASYTVFDLVSAGGESLQATALDDAAKNMYKELHQHLQMFDLIDMVSIISLCNKDIFARSLGCILIQETGKLKRLLVHKDKQRFILSDVLYYKRDHMIDNLVKRLSIFHGLKEQGFKPQKQLRQIFEKLQFYQFAVDNFEYQKFGLWESLVRDIQVLYMGDLTRLWKETLLKHTHVGGVILNYIQHLSGVALALYESKLGGGQDAAAQVSSQGGRDCVGFNLLLAVVLFNVTKSHDSRNRIPKVKDSTAANEDSNDEMEEVFSSGKITTNTIMEETEALIGLTETNFNQMHKITFSTFYPARLWTSNVLLSFLFYLQEPLDQKSLRNLNEIFIIKRLDFTQGDTKHQQFVENCLIFYTLLMTGTSGGSDLFNSYVADQIEQEREEQEQQVSLQMSQQEVTPIDDTSVGYPVSKNLQEMTAILTNTLESIEFTDDSQGKKKFILRITMAHSICTCIMKLRETSSNRVSSTQYLSRDQQIALLQETRGQFNSVSKSADLQWLLPMIKEIWFCLLSFEAIIGGNLHILDDMGLTESGAAPKLSIPAKLLDLKFLIQLEQDGYTGVLKYYKYFHMIQPESSGNPRASASSDASRINEIKLLIQHVYAFFGSKRISSKPLLPEAPIKSDLSQISGFSAEVSNYSRYPVDQVMRPQKNIYFKCLVNCVVDTIALCKALESMKAIIQGASGDGQNDQPSIKTTSAAQLAKSPFVPVYQTLVNCIFKQTKLNLESKLRKFQQGNLHSKLFLVSLFVGLNSTDKIFIEKSRILSLAILPLMFPDVAYRKIVEDKIIAHAQTSQIKTLISHENKHFYQFIKRVFLGEERFNMEHHFEKYFSLSGFLRDILNEIIKLQGSSDSDQPQISPKMLLKVLDIVTYFFSGNIDLRRAPHTMDPSANQQQQKVGKHLMLSQAHHQPTQEETFIFSNLIDYKSFEFLSKLYKISERLVDHDNDMLIMNMWYKVVENRTHNFEILSKFLIHNLSSFIMKLRATSTKDATNASISQPNNQSATADDDAYGIEYEKQKRYSLSIFNYIKARTQQIDIRNSLNVSSVCSWSQKMIKLVMRAQLNLHSKYTLEKLKLKKILQMLHAEINKSGVRLELKGGLETLNILLHEGDENESTSRRVAEPAQVTDDLRRSVSMSQLLQSRTFLETFGSHNKQSKSTLKQLLFIIMRQMSEKFDELTPDNQMRQLPDLVIKYFENTLIMIANESERLQIIKYTLREEMTVTIIIMILMADLATKQCDINRFYFMYDLLNKLSLNIPGIQRYLKLQQLSMEQFQSITSEEEVLAVFNYRSALDNFGVFTKTYFKLLLNTVAIAKLHKFMLQLWFLIFEKVQQLLSKSEQGQQRMRDSVMGGQPPLLRPLYSRRQIVTMLQGCFFSLHQYSMKSQRRSALQQSQSASFQGGGDIDDRGQIADVKTMLSNFNSQIKCVMEYILPAQLKMQSMRDFTDPFAQEISFATNSAFWLCYACLEAAAIATSECPISDSRNLDQTVDSGVGEPIIAQDADNTRHLQAIQEIGMVTMKRIMEESDFLKLLIGIQKLSPHFFSYSMSLKRGKTALLPLLFAALENPHCCEDAYKSLIVTIRIQDSYLLNCSKDEAAQGQTELHRFLLLVPFFYQQFIGYAATTEVESNMGLRKSTTLFTNKKSIIQLLKKSLLSIGIDKKKEILNILDEIQLEVDQGDPKVIKESFGRLIRATCDICIAQNCHLIIFEALRTFRAIASGVKARTTSQLSQRKATVVIESDLIEQIISEMKAAVRENASLEELEAVGLAKEAAEFYSSDQNEILLGEEVLFVRREIRPLYFGIKNIILQEMESLDKEIDVHKFFIEEETAGFPAQNQDIQSYVVNRSRSMYHGGPVGQPKLTVLPSGGVVSEGYSDTFSDMASSTQQQVPRMQKKATQRKQEKEMISKYQNSQNANAVVGGGGVGTGTYSTSPPISKLTAGGKVAQALGIMQASQPQLQPMSIANQSGAATSQLGESGMPGVGASEDMAYTAGMTSMATQHLKASEVRTSSKKVIVKVNVTPFNNAASAKKAEDGVVEKHRANVVVLEDDVGHHQAAVEDDEDYEARQRLEANLAGEIDSRRSSSKVHLEEDDRRVQQEQLSQILFEEDEEAEDGDQNDKKQLTDEFQLIGMDDPGNLSNIDIALEPSKLAARSFAESVILEDKKQKGMRGEGEKVKTQVYKASDFHPQRQDEAADGVGQTTSREFDGLIGTFAKAPGKAQTQKRVPSLHFTNMSPQDKKQYSLIHGEVPIDRDFEFSQAMSSIEVRQTDRDMQNRAALIPGFVADKVNEINSADSGCEFGTGDFPEEARRDPKQLQSQQPYYQQQEYAAVKKDAYRFNRDEKQTVESQVFQNKDGSSGHHRMSQIVEKQDDRQRTQRFDAQKDFGGPDHNGNEYLTGAGATADQRVIKTAAQQQNQQQMTAPPVKLGGKAANFLDSHKTEDLPTAKMSKQLNTLLTQIMNDEEQFYELENFLSEEKNYDVDSLAFYVKVMEFQKETNGMNATLAAGMIIDNYLAEDAQYYIGNEVKSDDLINRLISEYEFVIMNQRPVPKDLFDGVTQHIKLQLMPLLREFQARDPDERKAAGDKSSAFSSYV